MSHKHFVNQHTIKPPKQEINTNDGSKFSQSIAKGAKTTTDNFIGLIISGIGLISAYFFMKK